MPWLDSPSLIHPPALFRLQIPNHSVYVYPRKTVGATEGGVLGVIAGVTVGAAVGWAVAGGSRLR